MSISSTQPITSPGLLPRVSDCARTEIAYVIKPHLPRSSIVMVTGAAGDGKSSFATHWAGEASKEGRVLYLDRENPACVVNDRLQRLHVEDGYRDDGCGLAIWGGWNSKEAPDASTHPGLFSKWIGEADDDEPVLVIVDSLAAFFAGGDENDSAKMRVWLKHWRKLANLGACILILHHTGKAAGAKKYRGSSDILASVDAAYHLSNHPAGGHLNRLTLTVFKSRYGLTGKFVFKYANGLFVPEKQTEKPESDGLAALLSRHPGILAGDFEALAMRDKIPRAVARAYLDNGVAAKTVTCAGGGLHNKRTFELVTQHEPTEKSKSNRVSLVPSAASSRRSG